MLLNKGKVVGILGKKKDSGVVVKLVQELRQAVLLYQVGTVGSQRSSRANVFGIAIATKVDRQSDHTVSCEFAPCVFIIRTDGRLIESSLLSVHF